MSNNPFAALVDSWKAPPKQQSFVTNIHRLEVDLALPDADENLSKLLGSPNAAQIMTLEWLNVIVHAAVQSNPFTGRETLVGYICSTIWFDEKKRVLQFFHNFIDKSEIKALFDALFDEAKHCACLFTLLPHAALVDYGIVYDEKSASFCKVAYNTYTLSDQFCLFIRKGIQPISTSILSKKQPVPMFEEDLADYIEDLIPITKRTRTSDEDYYESILHIEHDNIRMRLHFKIHTKTTPALTMDCYVRYLPGHFELDFSCIPRVQSTMIYRSFSATDSSSANTEKYIKPMMKVLISAMSCLSNTEIFDALVEIDVLNKKTNRTDALIHIYETLRTSQVFDYDEQGDDDRYQALWSDTLRKTWPVSQSSSPSLTRPSQSWRDIKPTSAAFKARQPIEVLLSGAKECELKSSRNWVASRQCVCEPNSVVYKALQDEDVAGEIICTKETENGIALRVTCLVAKSAKIALLLLQELERYANIDYIHFLPSIPKTDWFKTQGYIQLAYTSPSLYKIIRNAPNTYNQQNYSDDTFDAIKSIKQWTTGVYYSFNRALRQGTITKEHLDFYKGIMAYFERFGVTCPFTKDDFDNVNMTKTETLGKSTHILYRGLSPVDRLAPGNAFFDLFDGDSTKPLNDKGFIAFSKISKISSDFASRYGKGMLLMFDMNEFPTGSQFIDIEPVSTLSTEREMLAMPGTITLVEKLPYLSTLDYDTWKARYAHVPSYSIQEAEAIAKMNTAAAPINDTFASFYNVDLTPLVPGQSALSTKAKKSQAGGAAKSMENLMKRFAKQAPDSKIDINGKVAIFYNMIDNRFQILQVTRISSRTFLPEELESLDGQQSSLPSIKALWTALEAARASKNKKLIVRLTNKAILSNVGVVILSNAFTVDSWRFGDLYDLPKEMRKSLFTAIEEHGKKASRHHK